MAEPAHKRAWRMYAMSSMDRHLDPASRHRYATQRICNLLDAMRGHETRPDAAVRLLAEIELWMYSQKWTEAQRWDAQREAAEMFRDMVRDD